MQVYVALLFTHKSFITLGMEQFPSTYQVHHHIDVRTRFYIEISCIEETTYIQTRNQFIRLVFRFRLFTLPMQVEMVARRGLQIPFLERFTVPNPITLVHRYMVHVNRNPDIGGGIGNLIVHMLIDKEIIGLLLPILNIINTRLTNG